MKKVKWLIQPDGMECYGLVNYLQHHQEELGCELILAKRREGSHFSFNWDAEILADDCVICYGDLFFIQWIQRYYNKWVPGTYCEWNDYKCSNYYSLLYPDLFNYDAVWVPLELLKKRKGSFYFRFGKHNKLFVRPDSGVKNFSGQVVSFDEFDEFAEPLITFEGGPLVLIAPARPIRREWRFFVSSHLGTGEIITGSQYREDGQTKLQCIDETPTALQEILKRFTTHYFPPSDLVCSVDLCESDTGEIFILEMNSFSNAGLYYSDKAKLTQAVTESARMDWEQYYE